MASINHCIGLNVTEKALWESISSMEGLRSWWTEDVRGESEKGGVIEFYFNKASLEMKVLELGREQILWECINGPDEWIGTNLSFDIKEDEGQQMLFFEHRGWKETSPFHYHCSMKWATFLLSLKNYLEGRKGTPFPNDIQITHTNG